MQKANSRLHFHHIPPYRTIQFLLLENCFINKSPFSSNTQSSPYCTRPFFIILSLILHLDDYISLVITRIEIIYRKNYLPFINTMFHVLSYSVTFVLSPPGAFMIRCHNKWREYNTSISLNFILNKNNKIKYYIKIKDSQI